MHRGNCQPMINNPNPKPNPPGSIKKQETARYMRFTGEQKSF